VEKIMDDAVLSFEQLVDCAKQYRSKTAGGGFGWGKGLMSLGNWAGNAASKVKPAIQTGAKAFGNTANAVGAGITNAAGAMKRNPGRTALGVGGVGAAGALGPGGYGADALGSMGIIDDPVKQWASNQAKHEGLRTNFYDNTYAPAHADFDSRLTAGTATADDYNNLMNVQNQLLTGEYGGGLFSANAKQVQQRAMDAATRMRQPYQPSWLKRMFGGFKDQNQYNQYAQDIAKSYGVTTPPGFGTHMLNNGQLIPRATKLDRSSGQMFAQARPDPLQMAMQNLYSDQNNNQLRSAWRY
jgi:hypothetical protein